MSQFLLSSISRLFPDKTFFKIGLDFQHCHVTQQLPYESPILGQLLDLISTAKIIPIMQVKMYQWHHEMENSRPYANPTTIAKEIFSMSWWQTTMVKEIFSMPWWQTTMVKEIFFSTHQPQRKKFPGQQSKKRSKYFIFTCNIGMLILI